MRFRNKAGRRSLDVIDDPREAAAVLVFGLAATTGEVGAEVRTAITEELARLFDLDLAAACELAVRAVWHVGGLNDAANVIAPLTDRLVSEVGRPALADLRAAMEAVAARDGGPTPDQVRYLDKFVRRAGF